MENRSKSFGFLQISGWLLLAYLVYAQAIPAFDYDLGVKMGTQEPAEKVTEVGVAFWYGFALADLLIYIPLLAAGLVGLLLRTTWAHGVMAAALGITVYWPAVCLVALARADGSPGWELSDVTQYWLVLPLIFIWAAWGLWWVLFRGDCSGRS